jgi:hypothetical protein
MESDNEFEIIDFTKYDNHKKIKEIKFRKTNCYIIPCTINKKNKKLSQHFVEGELIESNITVDLKFWLKDIKNSYKDNTAISKQFLVDFDRCLFFCNGHEVKQPDSFLDYLHLKCKPKQIKKILMLCSQTSFGLPYELIQNSLFENSKQEYFLAEVAYNNKLYYHKYRIYFTIKDDDIQFTICKYLRIFKLIDTNDYTVAIVEMFVHFNLKNKNVILKILYKPYKPNNK